MLGTLFNRVNDWELTWVGFRRLRPARDQDMTPRVVLILSLFYGPLAAALAVLGALLVLSLRQQTPTPRFLWGMGLGAASAFVLLQSLSAFFWNRRARRLRQGGRPGTLKKR